MIENHNCKHCQKPLARKKFGTRLEDRQIFMKRKYCHQGCMAMGMMKADPTRDAYRKRIYHLRKKNCEQCQTTEKLSIHHKDRNWRNNDPENLQTLCSSCHTSLHHAAGEISGRQSERPCKYCGRVSFRTTCNTCKTRIRRNGSPYYGRKEWIASFKQPSATL